MDAQIECLEEWNTAASAHSVGVELFDRIMADNTKTLLAETVCGAASAVYHTHEGSDCHAAKSAGELAAWRRTGEGAAETSTGVARG